MNAQSLMSLTELVNVTEVNAEQFLNASFSMFVTGLGIVIDVNAVLAKQ